MKNKNQQQNTVSATMMTYQLNVVFGEFVIIGVRIEHHLRVGVDCQVCFDGRQVVADEISHGLGLFFRLGSRSTVSFIAGVCRGTNSWKNMMLLMASGHLLMFLH